MALQQSLGAAPRPLPGAPARCGAARLACGDPGSNTARFSGGTACLSDTACKARAFSDRPPPPPPRRRCAPRALLPVQRPGALQKRSGAGPRQKTAARGARVDRGTMTPSQERQVGMPPARAAGSAASPAMAAAAVAPAKPGQPLATALRNARPRPQRRQASDALEYVHWHDLLLPTARGTRSGGRIGRHRADGRKPSRPSVLCLPARPASAARGVGARPYSAPRAAPRSELAQLQFAARAPRRPGVAAVLASELRSALTFDRHFRTSAVS